jgi:hypothetical protein
VGRGEEAPTAACPAPATLRAAGPAPATLRAAGPAPATLRAARLAGQTTARRSQRSGNLGDRPKVHRQAVRGPVPKRPPVPSQAPGPKPQSHERRPGRTLALPGHRRGQRQGTLGSGRGRLTPGHRRRQRQGALQRRPGPSRMATRGQLTPKLVGKQAAQARRRMVKSRRRGKLGPRLVPRVGEKIPGQLLRACLRTCSSAGADQCARGSPPRNVKRASALGSSPRRGASLSVGAAGLVPSPRFPYR